VCALARVVIQCRIRRKLTAPLPHRPTFGSCDESRTDSLSPDLRDDVPALEVADAIRATGIHDIADRELYEADRAVVVVEGHEHFGRFVTIARQKALRVALVLFEGTVWPQVVSEPYPIVSVLAPYCSD